MLASSPGCALLDDPAVVRIWPVMLLRPLHRTFYWHNLDTNCTNEWGSILRQEARALYDEPFPEQSRVTWNWKSQVQVQPEHGSPITSHNIHTCNVILSICCLSSYTQYIKHHLPDHLLSSKSVIKFGISFVIICILSLHLMLAINVNWYKIQVHSVQGVRQKFADKSFN